MTEYEGPAALPEEEQARALRAVEKARAERDRVVKRADEKVEAAAVRAARAGAQRTRIKELAGVSSKTLYAWLAAAGVPVRSKRPAARRKKPNKQP